MAGRGAVARCSTPGARSACCSVLRNDAAGLPSRGPGVWGELAERIRKLLRAREQQTRQAEDRLQDFLAAIQASPNGVVLLDEQGRIEWCNQTAAAQFGIDAERDLLQHLAQPGARPGLRGLPGLVELQPRRGDRRAVAAAPHRGHRSRLSVQVHPYAGNRRMLLTRDITVAGAGRGHAARFRRQRLARDPHAAHGAGRLRRDAAEPAARCRGARALPAR